MLCKIDIPVAHKEILKWISNYHRQVLLADLVEPFLVSLHGKRIDKRAAERLHGILVQHEELLVSSVQYNQEKRGDGSKAWRFTVKWHGMGDTWFTALHQPDGVSIDIVDAMIGREYARAMGEALTAKLEKFEYNATKFNDMVDALQNASEFAAAPNGLGGLYPLSEFFHYYQLSR